MFYLFRIQSFLEINSNNCYYSNNFITDKMSKSSSNDKEITWCFEEKQDEKIKLTTLPFDDEANPVEIFEHELYNDFNNFDKVSKFLILYIFYQYKSLLKI